MSQDQTNALPKELSIGEKFPPPGREAWLASLEKVLKGAPFEKRLVSMLPEGIAVQPLYEAEEVSPDGVGFPGLAPFIRGAAATPEGWTVCGEHRQPDLEALAADIRGDLAHGVGALLLRFDPTLRRSAVDEGAGVLLRSVRDMATALGLLDGASVEIHLDAGANATPAAALLFAAAKRAGVTAATLSGSLGADPLGAAARDGALATSEAGAYRDLADLVSYCAEKAPKVRAAVVSVEAHHDAGASAVEELGYAIATGVEYLRRLEATGVDLDTAAGQILFRFSIGRDLFVEISKLRAARGLWSRVLEASGIDPALAPMRIHATPSKRTLTLRDPWVNLLRTTVQSFAAAVGGADLASAAPFDAATRTPTPFARRIANNAHAVLSGESNLHRVADAAGGSAYVEALTTELSRSAWELFQTTESLGGMHAAFSGGAVARQIHEVAERRLDAIARRKEAITGVSSFPNLGEEPLPVEDDGIAALRAMRRAEPSTPPLPTLADLGARTAAAIVAAEKGSSFSAIADATNTGEEPWIPTAPLQARRDAAPFEELRDASDGHLARHGTRPRVFLANLGAIPEHRARAEFAAAFLGAGGIETLSNDGFEDVEAASAAFAASGATAAAICSTDDRYAAMVPALGPALREQGAKTLILAGKPGAREASDREAGVTAFIHVGCDALEMLRGLHVALGVNR